MVANLELSADDTAVDAYDFRTTLTRADPLTEAEQALLFDELSDFLDSLEAEFGAVASFYQANGFALAFTVESTSDDEALTIAADVASRLRHALLQAEQDLASRSGERRHDVFEPRDENAPGLFKFRDLSVA